MSNQENLSLSEIDEKISALQMQKQAILSGERSKRIEAIKKDILAFGITQADLFDVRSAKKARNHTNLAKGVEKDKKPQYKGPNDELWAGGLGRKPRWVMEIINNGGNIEDYRIADSMHTSTPT